MRSIKNCTRQHHYFLNNSDNSPKRRKNYGLKLDVLRQLVTLCRKKQKNLEMIFEVRLLKKKNALEEVLNKSKDASNVRLNDVINVMGHKALSSSTLNSNIHNSMSLSRNAGSLTLRGGLLKIPIIDFIFTLKSINFRR